MMKFFQRGTVRVSVSQLAMNNTLRTSDMAQMQDKRSPSTVTRDTGCNKCEHPYIPSVKKGAQADHQAGEVEQSLSSRSSPKSSASPSKCLVVRMPLTGRSTSMRASIRPSSLVVRNDPSSPDWLLTIREHIQRQRQLESILSSHISVKC